MRQAAYACLSRIALKRWLGLAFETTPLGVLRLCEEYLTAQCGTDPDEASMKDHFDLFRALREEINPSEADGEPISQKVPPL